MTFELVAHLHRIDMKQTLVFSRCDWLILNSMSKDELRSATSIPNSPFHKRPEKLCRTINALHSLEQ